MSNKMSAWDHFTYHWWKIRILLFILLIAGAAYTAFYWINGRITHRFDHWPLQNATIVESHMLETTTSDEHKIQEKLFIDLDVEYEINGKKCLGELVVTGASWNQYQTSFSHGKEVSIRVNPDSPETIAFFWKDQPGIKSRDSGGSLP